MLQMKRVVFWKKLDNAKQTNFNALLLGFAFLQAGNVTDRLIAMVAAMSRLESVESSRAHQIILPVTTADAFSIRGYATAKTTAAITAMNLRNTAALPKSRNVRLINGPVHNRLKFAFHKVKFAMENHIAQLETMKAAVVQSTLALLTMAAAVIGALLLLLDQNAFVRVAKS
jgi:hypothetical protein